MVHSMTAYGEAAGAFEDWRWHWEMRSVNGRGLDLKLRLPEGFGFLEADCRRLAAQVLGRGSVSVALKFSKGAGEAAREIDAQALRGQLALLASVQEIAAEAGQALTPLSQADALSLPGVLRDDSAAKAAERQAAQAPLLHSFEAALAALRSMRATEGAALAALFFVLLDQIEQLCGAAEAMAPERAAHQSRVLSEALARVQGIGEGGDPDRLAQELAMIAVKGDVTEELDRLRLHIQAAKDLLAQDGPMGRKLDFLTQEFNREANTLCSKAQYAPLTQIGLDLKAAIDQMREQVQNVE
ncbi:MAG: YicC family protein [Mangrovicoccus sp.]|nr:YicC family protein [Mangrovicoccus sp.]